MFTDTNLNAQAAQVTTAQQAQATQAQPQAQPQQGTTSFFPQTSATADGNNYNNQNPKLGMFKGVIKAIRPVQSKVNPMLFAVLDIEVEGETLPFQEYLNFNPAKDNASLQYLVNICKTIAKSAGLPVNADELWSMAKVEQALNEFIQLKTPVTFIQERTNRGLSITFC